MPAPTWRDSWFDRHVHAPGSGRRRPAEQRRLRGLPAHGRPLGAPADVHVVRPRRVLRQLAQPPRHRALHLAAPPDHPVVRTGRGLVVLLRRRARVRRRRRPIVRAPGRRRSRARRSTRSSMPIRPPVRVLALTSGTTRAGVPADRPPPQCCAAAARRPADMGGVGSASNSINCRSGSGLVRVRFWSSVERQGSARPACFPPQSRASPVGSAAAETPSARRHGEGLPPQWEPLTSFGWAGSVAGGLLDEVGDGGGLGDVDGVAAGDLDDRRAGPLGHGALAAAGSSGRRWRRGTSSAWSARPAR